MRKFKELQEDAWTTGHDPDQAKYSDIKLTQEEKLDAYYQPKRNIKKARQLAKNNTTLAAQRYTWLKTADLSHKTQNQITEEAQRKWKRILKID